MLATIALNGGGDQSAAGSASPGPSAAEVMFLAGYSNVLICFGNGSSIQART